MMMIDCDFCDARKECESGKLIISELEYVCQAAYHNRKKYMEEKMLNDLLSEN